MTLRISLDQMLCGATEPSSWCRQHFDDYIKDIDSKWDPEDMEPVPSHSCYAFATSTDSVLLLHQDRGSWRVAGYYNTPGAVCIHPDHQGKGLGAELVLYTAVHWSGGPPTTHLDEQCFSAAGLAAHKAAWRLGVARGSIVDPQVDYANARGDVVKSLLGKGRASYAQRAAALMISGAWHLAVRHVVTKGPPGREMAWNLHPLMRLARDYPEDHQLTSQLLSALTTGLTTPADIRREICEIAIACHQLEQADVDRIFKVAFYFGIENLYEGLIRRGAIPSAKAYQAARRVVSENPMVAEGEHARLYALYRPRFDSLKLKAALDRVPVTVPRAMPSRGL